MLSIFSKSNDAYFNLATEELLLKYMQEECFYMYINEPSLIVGKHQNTLSEINYNFVKNHNIKVVRRMTGGGCVYHDEGNLNFCFIMKKFGDNNHDFETYTKPILQVLQEMGLDARLEGRNDLTIDGRKFSGNAKLIWKDLILQHGTILFATNMDNMAMALNINPIKFSDKSVKSIASRVANISDFLSKPLELGEFIRRIREHIHRLYPEAEEREFIPEEIAIIEHLVNTKYKTWDWNFGSSPKYNFNKSIKTEAGTIDFYLQVENGIIESIRVYGDFFPLDDPAQFEDMLRGLPHREEILRMKLAGMDLSRWFNRVPLLDILSGLF